MTPDERELLRGFLDDLRRVPSGPRDSEAARMIEEALSGHPEAIYLLVQHALLADQALHEAQRRIEALEAQVNAAPATSGTFLHPSASPWGNEHGSSQPGTREGVGFFAGGAPAQPGGFSSFLRNTAATAAGMAGGAFLFEGLSNLFGPHHVGSFLGGGLAPRGESAPLHEYQVADTTSEGAAYADDTEETEYYDDDADDVGNVGDIDTT